MSLESPDKSSRLSRLSGLSGLLIERILARSPFSLAETACLQRLDHAQRLFGRAADVEVMDDHGVIGQLIEAVRGSRTGEPEIAEKR